MPRALFASTTCCQVVDGLVRELRQIGGGAIEIGLRAESEAQTTALIWPPPRVHRPLSGGQPRRDTTEEASRSSFEISLTPTSFVTSSCSATLFCESRHILQKRLPRRRRAHDEDREGVVAPAGLDVAFPEMEQMAARLHFTRPTQITWFDVQALERVRPGDHDVIGDDGAEFEREDVERAFELDRRHNERRRDVAVMPALRASRAHRP